MQLQKKEGDAPLFFLPQKRIDQGNSAPSM
jgi:hypothetical protein